MATQHATQAFATMPGKTMAPMEKSMVGRTIVKADAIEAMMTTCDWGTARGNDPRVRM